jgi:hypothetical protein
VIPHQDVGQHQHGDEYDHRNTGRHREHTARVANPLDHLVPVPDDGRNNDRDTGRREDEARAIPLHHRRGADEGRDQQERTGNREVAAHVSFA